MYVVERDSMPHNAVIAQNPDSILAEAVSVVLAENVDVFEVSIEVDIVEDIALVTEDGGDSMTTTLTILAATIVTVKRLHTINHGPCTTVVKL